MLSSLGSLSWIIRNQFVSTSVFPTWQIPPVSHSRRVKTRTKDVFAHAHPPESDLHNTDARSAIRLEREDQAVNEVHSDSNYCFFFVVFFFHGLGWSAGTCKFLLLETQKDSVCYVPTLETNTWTSDNEYGGDFAVSTIPPGVAMSGYEHFFLLTTVSTRVKSFGCKSADRHSVSQQSAGTN